MPELTLPLLGPPLLAVNGKSVGQLLRKAIALIAYLSVDRQPHSRDALATLLWPECGQSRARASSPPTSTPSVALREGAAGTIWGRPARSVSCFSERRRASTRMTSSSVSPSPTALISMNGSCSRGSGCAASSIPCSAGSPKGHEARALYPEALGYARRLLSLDRLEESAHRLVMRLYALSGQRAAALRQYEDCRRILKAELYAEPEEETLSLVASVRDRSLAPRGAPRREKGHDAASGGSKTTEALREEAGGEPVGGCATAVRR